MQLLETIFYFVVTLGLLVFVHELGHFLAAKLCGMRAEVFALGMGHRLFGYNRVNGFTFWQLDESLQLGENTDYRVAMLPIGGYVKIVGMIDESLDTEHLDRPPEPWEFRARPLWQRTIVICAGVIMNILLAVVIFWGIKYSEGDVVWATTEVSNVISGSPAEAIGMIAGDKIIEMNETRLTDWGLVDLIYFKSIGGTLKVVVLREGNQITLSLPRVSIRDGSDVAFGLIPSPSEVFVGQVTEGMPAEQLGLEPGDIILSINGIPTADEQSLRNIIRANPGKPITVNWRRGERDESGVTTPTSEGLIGIEPRNRYTGPVKTVHYGLFEALPRGIHDIWQITVISYHGIWKMIIGEASLAKNIAGPIKIAQMASRTAQGGLSPWLMFVGLLSISLAILNILPFPALDGGHLMFLLYEVIFRREIPTRVTLAIQKAGIALLLAFMAFVLFNDIANF